jgi:antitoxin (DNA-binding transcriptional repressor) of toxin-antitoxin stability system
MGIQPPQDAVSAGDSAGITVPAVTAADLPVAALAPHPANPRGDLGDLAELQASIAQIGVLEPLVVVTAAAHLAGGWPAAADAATPCDPGRALPSRRSDGSGAGDRAVRGPR